MLSENIKSIRKAKGLSQEELAVRLNVVRQTISKWEKGLSTPDSDLLIAISEALETPVSTLLSETVVPSEDDRLNGISQKLETIESQLVQRKEMKKKVIHWLFISLTLITALIVMALFLLKSPYLNWDYHDLERAVLGVAFHSFEWIFVRLAPITLAGCVTGMIMTRKKAEK